MLAARRLIIAHGEAGPSHWNSFAWWLLTNELLEERHPREALDVATRASAATNDNTHFILDTLALALFRNDRIEDAIATQENAVRLAEADSTATPDMLTGMRAQLELFRRAECQPNAGSKR